MTEKGSKYDLAIKKGKDEVEKRKVAQQWAQDINAKKKMKKKKSYADGNSQYGHSSQISKDLIRHPDRS